MCVSFNLCLDIELCVRPQAYSLIQKHGSMEEILANLDKAKYPVPDPYPYEEARRLFRGEC